MRAIPLQFEPSRTVVPIGVFVFLMSLTVGVNAQDERPDVHADFKYGVFPYSSEAVERFAPEPARLMISAFHKGWNVDKYIKESGIPEVEVLTLLQEFEDDRLVRGRNDYDLRPGFPVYREDELPETAPLIAETAAGFVRTIESQWGGFEELVSSLEAGQNFPREEMLYRVVAGGLLFGGMIDALFDDKTLMPAPPRRAGRREAYYAWMTEGDAGPPQLILQSAPVGRYNVFSIGTVPVDEPRVEIGELGRNRPCFRIRRCASLACIRQCDRARSPAAVFQIPTQFVAGTRFHIRCRRLHVFRGVCRVVLSDLRYRGREHARRKRSHRGTGNVLPLRHPDRPITASGRLFGATPPVGVTRAVR